MLKKIVVFLKTVYKIEMLKKKIITLNLFLF